MTAATGLCRNPSCPKNNGEPIERYPGAGEFCPECGERLEPIDNIDDVEETLRSAIFLSKPKAVPPRPPRLVIPAIALGLVLVVAALAAGAMAIGRSKTALRICPSSITQRLATDVVGAYTAANPTDASRFDLTPSGGCDVRFTIAENAAPHESVIAHDAVVVIVNPQSPLTRLTRDQIRGVIAGTITDWSQLHDGAGPIVAMLPEDGTDEAKLAETTLLGGTKAGSHVKRLSSSAAVTRAVAAASGRRTIGIVAFSAAPPAKVLSLDSSTPPSAVSIADHRYPYSVAIAVAHETNNASAVALTQFIRSDAVQSIVVRDGYIAKEGF